MQSIGSQILSVSRSCTPLALHIVRYILDALPPVLRPREWGGGKLKRRNIDTITVVVGLRVPGIDISRVDHTLCTGNAYNRGWVKKSHGRVLQGYEDALLAGDGR